MAGKIKEHKATERSASRSPRSRNRPRGRSSSVRTITTTMQEVDGFTTAIPAAVEEQGAATEEISRNVQMAARGTEDLTQNVAGVTGAIGETSRAAQDVLDVSGKLGSHANALRDEVDRFRHKWRRQSMVVSQRTGIHFAGKCSCAATNRSFVHVPMPVRRPARPRVSAQLVVSPRLLGVRSRRSRGDISDARRAARPASRRSRASSPRGSPV